MSASDGRPRVRVSLLLAALVAASTGCVEASLRERFESEDYEPVAPAALPAPSEGAIWRGDSSSGSFLFFDRKARGIGDLVTVLIIENNQAEGSAKTETGADSTAGASVRSDVGFQTLVATPIRNLLGTLGFLNPGRDVAAGTEVNVLESTKNNEFNGEGTTSRSGRFTGVITCRVVDVLPGGIFHIRGKRNSVVNHESELITLEALVRREDISINNAVPSTALAEMRLTYDGLGVIDDKQRVGWLARVFDWIYPF